jgi:hypothetical protein
MTKKSEKADGGFQVFDKPGSKQEVAINFTTGQVIESAPNGEFFVYISGVRHAIKSDGTLSDLLEGIGAAAPQEK